MRGKSKTLMYGDVELHYETKSGQLRRVVDRSLDMEVICFQSGHELEINSVPVPLQLKRMDPVELGPAWQCELDAEWAPSIGCGQSLRVFRQIVVGSAQKPGGNHINPPNALHLRYRIDRRQVQEYDDPVPHHAGRRPIQPPLWLDTIGAFCARTRFFGSETRMIAAHHSGSGPRAHVGHDEGPPAEVAQHLWNKYRTTSPGVQIIPGAIYTHPDGRWLWITCRRPHVGMHWQWSVDCAKAQFEYHGRLQPAEIVHTPEVSLYWGRGGRAELMACLNDAFMEYREPPAWWWNTTWYWQLWWQYRARGLEEMAEQALYLHEKLGVNGFGLTVHDVRPGSWDCATSGLGPSPHLGGEDGVRRFCETVHSFGGHVYLWQSYLGLGQPSLDLRPEWVIRGEDGRPWESFYIDSFDMYYGLNFRHPEVREYYLGWLRRYVGELGVDGIFWDCGGTPQAPDFSPPQTRSFQRFPSESMVAGFDFMKEILRVGRQCSPDFFMWQECFSTDLPATGYNAAVKDGAEIEFLRDLNRYGRKRIVYRSSSRYNLYGGMPSIVPGQDTSFRSPLTIASYEEMVNDPMNHWIVEFVARHGCRNAVALDAAASLCAGHVVIDPGQQPRRDVVLPRWAAEAKRLRDVHTGEAFAPSAAGDEAVIFSLPVKAAYEIG